MDYRVVSTSRSEVEREVSRVAGESGEWSPTSRERGKSSHFAGERRESRFAGERRYKFAEGEFV